MRFALLPILLWACAPLQAADTPRFAADRLSHHVEILASDAFEGRAPATRAEPKTIGYIVDQLKSAGVAPGGDLVNGQRLWTQAVPLLRSAVTGTPRLTLVTNGQLQSLTQGEQIALRAPLTGARHVAIHGAPLVFVGYGVAAPERQWDDFKGVDLRGKIMVVLINDPDFETGEGDFGGKAMTYYGRWTYKFEEAARRGAAGTLIIHETDPAAYGWTTVRNSNTAPMFDIVRADPAQAHAPIEAWITRDLAASLFAQSGLDFATLKTRAQSRDFKPVTLAARLDADYDADAGVITSHNVAGRLAGTQYPDETLIYSAHWDHFGIGAPDASGDRVYHGAVDNGTGVAAVLEMARAFAAAPRTARSELFLFVTAEERGLLGSEYYAANPLYPLATTVAMLNTDAMGVDGPARNFSMSGSAKLDLLDELTALAATRGKIFTPDPHPERGHFFRSDHFPLAKRGVPALSFESGNDLLTGGIERGEAISQAYTRDKYHQPADRWSADWDLTGLAGDLDLLFTLGTDLANSRRWPNWSPDSEFRAVRDASAAARRP